MVMPPNLIRPSAPMYVRAEMCYDTHCRVVEVPWVREFELLDKLADIAVLDDPSGKWDPGLYVRYDLKTWRLALTYQDVSNLLLTGNQVKVIVQAKANSTMPQGWTVFKNAQKQSSATVTASQYDVWVGVLSEGEFNAGAVSKSSAASTDNVFQVSDGTTRNIKDWAPSPGGIAMVDANGKAAVAKLDANLFSGDGSSATPFTINKATATKPGIVDLAQSTDFPAKADDLNAATPAYVDKAITDAASKTKLAKIAGAASDALTVNATDPSITLVVNGSNSNALSVRTMRSLGGVHLGHVVVGAT